MTPWRPSATRPSPPASPWMRGLYSGFDAARASWEFPEGTCAGFLGYPSDPANDGLESTAETGAADQDLLDNDGDTAVKVSREKINCKNLKIFVVPDLLLRGWPGRGPHQLGRGAVAGPPLRERDGQPAGGRQQARLRLAPRVRGGGARGRQRGGVPR